MHRIDTSGATVDNKFFDGSPAQGIPSTIVDDDWLNAVQEELAHIVLQGGLALEKNNNTQVWQALLAKFAALTDLAAHAALTNPHSATNLATANRMILRDGFGRAKVADPSANTDIATLGTVLTYYNAAVALNLGIAQSWQVVTGSRAAGVNYQNTSGKPIMVAVNVSGYGTSELLVGVDTGSMIRIDAISSVDNARPIVTGLQAIIPPNHYYRCNNTGWNGSILSWHELRA